MKYPNEQFKTLKQALLVLKQYIDISSVNIYELYFIVYQNLSKNGFEHCLLMYNNETKEVKKTLEVSKNNLQGFELIDFGIDFNFELYPNDTNDDNIGTAMKKALKEVL